MQGKLIKIEMDKLYHTNIKLKLSKQEHLKHEANLLNAKTILNKNRAYFDPNSPSHVLFRDT